MKKRTQTPFLTMLGALLGLTLSGPAFAHTAGGLVGGFQSGALHPLMGTDHLLAMLAVGLWGAQMGGRTVWTLPVAFPLVMMLGGIAGIVGLPLPHTELGIAFSLLVLGLAIACAWKPFEAIALAIIAGFAIFHGHAHGTELPNAADPAAYAIGFVLMTGLIHVAGVGIGLGAQSLKRDVLVRAAGAGIAALGVFYALA